MEKPKPIGNGDISVNGNNNHITINIVKSETTTKTQNCNPFSMLLNWLKQLI